MSQRIYDVVQWVKYNGDSSALMRLRLRMLAHSAREGIVFDKIGPNTRCSALYLETSRQAAEEIVGKPVAR